MTDIKKLMNQIEYLRHQLHHVGAQKGVLDEETIKISQELDDLLNSLNKEQNDNYINTD